MIDPLPGDIFRRGQVLNNTYEIEGLLGRGGTGEVYRARNQITGRVVAIKALNRAFSANADYVELMKREEEIRAISHDAVVRYTDCSRTADDHVYLVMDYVDGTPLSDWLERGGARARDLMVVAHRVAEGLVATHAAGIVHRDLSPDNIVLRGGNPEEAVIIDFGIAKDTNTGARTIVGNDFAGKYEYAAPEQMHGQAEPRSDLYALGAALLATFRGAVPDIGTSPGQVIRAKERPLDVDGVPEPLKTLIADLTQPDPTRRPPSAKAVAADIERLLKVPGAAKVGAGRRRRIWPLAVPVLAAAVAAGVWYSGLVDRFLTPPLPVAAPYTLAASVGADGRARLEGHAPDAAQRAVILEGFAAATGQSAAEEAVVLAEGASGPDWGAEVAALLAAAAPLAEWDLALSDRTAVLDGLAADGGQRDSVAAGFTEVAAAAGFAPEVRLVAGPRELAAAQVEEWLGPLETCGALSVGAPGAGAFALGETVRVAGNVASAEDGAAITAALGPRVGDRTLALDLGVLNPELCTVKRLLPDVPAGNFSIVFGYGDRDEPNMAGVYAVGDNPVIDILMPETVTEGHVWVAIADVTGNNFNVLPHIGAPEDAIARLGTVANGVRDIRVAYSVAERLGDPSRIAFTVDDTFGKSLVMVLHSDRPLFDTLRPIEESVESFAEDLTAALESGQVEVLSIATRLIDSRN
jgi:predicted Ser/Thr protein kinase